MGFSLKHSLVLSVLMCLCYSAPKSLPSWLELCHQDDPNLNECFKKAALEVQKRLLKGIPELLIPPMNPLVIPEVRLDSGQSFKASFKNIQIYHADQFTLEGLNVDLQKVHLDIKIAFPKMRIKSEYAIDGRILILELKGHGPADGNYTNLVADLVIDGSRYIKNGKEHLKFDSKALNLNLGKPVLRFDNIFGDNEELNDQTNRVVNENIGSIIEELKPVIDDAVTQFAFGLVERIFDRYSFDELFPK